MVRPFFLPKTMKKLITLILTLTVLFITSAGTVRAQELAVSPSASFKKDAKTTDFDYRVVILKRFLEKFNSPLSPYAEEFVASADKYGIDYRLVPAITGVESTFGKRIPYKSYNAYGWANGDAKFKSWEDSIEHVTMTLRKKYIDRGAPTISKIARRYAPPSKTWGTKVTYFVRKIDTVPVTYDL